jgi:hypothetical protein
MALTTGQSLAAELVSAARSGRPSVAAGELLTRLEEAVRAADADRRPLERELAAGRARERLSEALGWVVRRGLVRARDRRVLELATAPLLADATLQRLAREYTSSRETAA